MITVHRKSPAEVLDYDAEWSLDETEDILTSTWATTGTGLTINSSTFAAASVKVWLSGGTLGSTYTLTNTITTSLGRTLVDAFRIVVREP